MKLNLCAPCLFGLEGIAADEFKRLGFADVLAENGRVNFSGDFDTVIKANLWSRYGERILITMATFKATTFEELFQGVKAVAWEDFIPIKGEFPVKGHSLNSMLESIPNCQKIIKKAAVERLKEHYHIDWFDETGEKYQIQFAIMKDIVSIYLDTTGSALHKRGYRKNGNDAPIRETLAAAMTDIARYRGRDDLLDPFCGSGTILIEAALKATNRAPGMSRSFACENWDVIPKKLWSDARTNILDGIRTIDGKIEGRDIDMECVELSRDNAKKAGVGNLITFEQADVTKTDLSDYKGIIITNPPYGERLTDVPTAEKLYRDFGHSLGDLSGKRIYVISSHDAFESALGKKADKKRKLYNGMIKCDLFMYFK